MLEAGLIIIKDIHDNLSLAVIQMKLAVCTHPDIHRHKYTVQTESEDKTVKEREGRRDCYKRMGVWNE